MKVGKSCLASLSKVFYSIMRILAVTNMYPMPNEPPFGIYIEQQVKGLREIGVEVEVLFLNRRKNGIGIYLQLSKLLENCIAKFQPDIVHVMYGGIMADLATRIVRDRPTIVTFHGSDLLGEHLSGACRKLVSECGVWASRRAARRATGIVTVGRTLQEALPVNINMSKVRIIPCGIDLERFKPMDRSGARDTLGWKGDKFHVLFSTNYADPVKRPELAKAAVASLDRSGVKAELHQLYGISNDEVPVWLSASDVLLITSRHEGSPTIVKEALACNLPVVSVDVGDVRAQLENLQGCYIANAHPEDLAMKLKLVHDGIRIIDGRQHMEKMSLENIAIRLVEFYQEAISLFLNKSRWPLPFKINQDPSA